MKTNTISLSLYGDPRNVEKICGRYSSDIETTQVCTYTVENGLATITELKPVFKLEINLTLPFVLPANDLGSGMIKFVEINCDTLRPHTVICPTSQWVERRKLQPVLDTQQMLWADYNSLH